MDIILPLIYLSIFDATKIKIDIAFLTVAAISTVSLFGLLTLLSISDSNQRPERVSIFDPVLEGYFWSYDNDGLKNLHLRFYEARINLN